MKKRPTTTKSPAATFAKTRNALAAACGVSRPTLRRFLRMPGAPTEIKGRGWSVAAVRKWILTHASRGDLAGKLDPETDALRRWLIFERTRAIKLKNDFETGIVMLRSESWTDIAGRVHACHAAMGRVAARLAPEVAGLPLAEIEKRIALAIREALKCLHFPNGQV